MKRLSWSKAKTLNRCERQFKYNYLTDLEQETNELMQEGTDFHEYMDIYYDNIDEPNLEEALILMQNMFPEKDYSPFVENFHHWNVKLRERWGEFWKPVLREKKLEVPEENISDIEVRDKVLTEPMEGVVHVGIIDRIQYDPESESYGIIDYKRSVKEGSNIKGQVAYYSFLCEAVDLLDMVPEWGGCFGYDTGNFSRWKIHWQSEKAVARKILELKQKDSKSNYASNFGFHCKWCGFESECFEEEHGLNEYEVQK